MGKKSIKELCAKDIMVRRVLTVDEDSTLALAKLKMLRSAVGGLVVLNREGEMVGMITLRDISLVGETCLEIPVKELMSRNPVTISEDTDVAEIARIMMETGYQRLPVVRGGRLVGLVTQSSVIRVVAEWEGGDEKLEGSTN